MKEFYITISIDRHYNRVKFKKEYDSGNGGPDHKDKWGPGVLLGLKHPVPVSAP